MSHELLLLMSTDNTLNYSSFPKAFGKFSQNPVTAEYMTTYFTRHVYNSSICSSACKEASRQNISLKVINTLKC